MLKNLLGNSSRDKELAEEVRAVLQEMREERERFELLLTGSQDAAESLTRLSEPVARVAGDVEAIATKLGSLQQRVDSVSALAEQIQALDELSQGLIERQTRAEEQIASAVEDSHRIRTVFEELAQKTDLAESLRGRLEAFLEVEKPFKMLQGDADGVRTQIEGATEQLGRVREQHDRLMDAHKLGTSKMEALDRRREELSRDLQDKERRVVDVEHVVREMDGIRQTVNDVKRSMGSLKTLSDSVAQKISAVEAQKEAVERALAQSENLERAMRQLDLGVKQQQENEKSLVATMVQVEALAELHENVLERSSEISQLERQSGEQIGGIKDQLSAARDEVKNAVERFDFEGKGLESASQRVADLRSALSEFEGRYRTLSEAGMAVRELTAQAQVLAPRIQELKADVARIDEDAEQLHAIRRELDEATKVSAALGSEVAKIESMRPAVEAVRGDVERLSGTHAMVKDTIEQAKLAHAEITRMIAGQAETRSWLITTESAITELRARCGELDTVAPTLGRVEQQAERIQGSITAIETRREFLEGLHQRLAEFGALSATLDERGLSLVARMDAAEQRFVGFAAHAEEADRIGGTIATVTSGVEKAAKKTDAIGKSVTALEARCASVEELAGQTRILKDEIDQRQAALAAAAKDLERATKLRSQAADSAQELGELATRLDEALASAKTWSAHLDQVATQLEERETNLESVDQRFSRFETRLAKWDIVDQQVTRALDQMAARQGTVQALQADLDRMFAMAETTCENVRTITTAQRETAESRAMLKTIVGRLEEMRGLAGTLDERERQVNKAEERLARAEGFLGDVKSGLDTLQGQKALVDQAVEKVGALKFLLKQADAMIDGLRDERRMTSNVQEARASDDDESAADEEGIARAA